MTKTNNESLDRLKNGAFLTSGNPANVMTIAWGALGFFWRKNVFIAPVRKSRYTKEFLDMSGFFAVSIPNDGDYIKELAHCGKVSGRDENKIAKLATRSAIEINTVVIDGCQTFYECRVLAVIPIDDSMLDASIKQFYKEGDYHYLYYGEILKTY